MASRLTLRHVFRHYSAFVSSFLSKPLTSREKSRIVLRLIKSDSNPERILEICRYASLRPEFRLDHNVLSFAFTKLTAANNFDGIHKFIDELLQTRPDLNERFISHAILLYGHANMLPHALRTFNHMCDELHITPSVKSLNALLRASIIANDHKEVTRIYLEFPKIYSIQPNVDTYNLVIKSFVESGSTSSVFSILDEMDKNYTEPNAVTFNNAIAGFYNEKKFDEVDKLMNLMEERYKMHPDLSTYNLVIKSYAESGSTSSVFSILDEMDRNSIEPNTVTFNNAIAGFYNEKKFDEVDKLMNLMEERYKMHPDLSTYNVRIKSLCKLKRSSEAKALFQEIITAGMRPNSDSYRHLIHGFCKEGNLEEAEGLLDVMEEKERYRLYTYGGGGYFTLVYSLCERGEFESALEIVKDISYYGWFPSFNTMKKLVNGLVGVSKIDDAKELIKEIRKQFPESSDKWDEVEAGFPEQ